MTRRTLFITLGLAIGSGLLLVVGAVGACISFTTEVDATKAWCEQVAADLEAWRALHGQYPGSLAEAGIGKDPPAMENLQYWTREEGFRLSFSDNLHIERVYDSKERRWSR